MGFNSGFKGLSAASGALGAQVRAPVVLLAIILRHSGCLPWQSLLKKGS